MITAEQLVDQVVVHKIFGEGIVHSVNGTHLEVHFVEKSKVSKFAYPSCFEGFLILQNSSLQSEVEKDIEVWRQESGAVQKEALRHQYEMTLQGIEARRIALEEKKLKAAQKIMEHRSSHSYNNERRNKKNG